MFSLHVREVFIVIDRMYRHRHARAQTVSHLALLVPQNMLTIHRSILIMFHHETLYMVAKTSYNYREREWCLPSRLPQTRLISGRILDLAPVQCCLGAPPALRSRFELKHSAC